MRFIELNRFCSDDDQDPDDVMDWLTEPILLNVDDIRYVIPHIFEGGNFSLIRLRGHREPSHLDKGENSLLWIKEPYEYIRDIIYRHCSIGSLPYTPIHAAKIKELPTIENYPASKG